MYGIQSKIITERKENITHNKIIKNSELTKMLTSPEKDTETYYKCILYGQ